MEKQNPPSTEAHVIRGMLCLLLLFSAFAIRLTLGQQNAADYPVDLTKRSIAMGHATSINNGGSFITHGYNISSDDGSGLLNGPGDQINTDPMLGPLQDNGGPTFTHALLPGSPAIDMGDPNFTPPPYYDQRGPVFFRMRNNRIDVGSFEVQSGTTPSPTPTATATATATPTVTHNHSDSDSYTYFDTETFTDAETAPKSADSAYAGTAPEAVRSITSSS